MAGIDEHCRVAGLDSLYELCDRGLHVQEAEIVSLLNGIAFFPQQAGIALRVGPRLLQYRDVLVAVVADDERQPVLRERGRREEKPRDQDRDPRAHRRLPMTGRLGRPPAPCKAAGLPANCRLVSTTTRTC